jgi:hypothetical protein
MAPEPISTAYFTTNKQIPWPNSASDLCQPSDRRLSAKLVPNFADRGCHIVSVTDPYGRIFGFLDRSRCFFFQVAPQLYSRGWVDPVPNPLVSRKSVSAGNRTRTPGTVARNSDRRGGHIQMKWDTSDGHTTVPSREIKGTNTKKLKEKEVTK